MPPTAADVYLPSLIPHHSLRRHITIQRALLYSGLPVVFPRVMCFVKGKDLASYRDDRRYASLQGHRYWKPFSLTFLSPSKEQWFCRLTHPGFHLQDFVGHSIGLLATPVFLHSIRDTVAPWYALLFFFLAYPYALVHTYAYLRHREWFQRTRSWSVAILRIMTLVLSVGIEFFTKPPPASIGQLLIAMLVKSPVMTLLFTSLMHRIEFRKHVIIQAVALTCGLAWIPTFCAKCSSSPSVMDRFQQMGYAIDWMFSFTFLSKDPDPVVYPCWMLSVLFTTVFGFIFPTLLIFIMEVISRAMFIKSRVSHKFYFDLFNYTNHAMKVGILAGLCSILGTWFLLQVTRTLLY